MPRREFFTPYAHDFVRVGVCVPRIEPADPTYNVDRTLDLIERAEEHKVALLAFPELGISAYAIDDLRAPFGELLIVLGRASAVGSGVDDEMARVPAGPGHRLIEHALTLWPQARAAEVEENPWVKESWSLYDGRRLGARVLND